MLVKVLHPLSAAPFFFISFLHTFLTLNTLDMKKLLLSIFPALALSANAQTVFWSEDFSTGCNQGAGAASYAGSNGAWSTTSTGTNDPEANLWFVSATEAFTGSYNCGDGCGNNASLTNATLHIGNAAITTLGLPADNGATYNTGGLCQSFAICVITNTRAESPVIDCSAASGITLSFSYMEGGDNTVDDGTVWYYDGSSWSLLTNPSKTSTQCAPQGHWQPLSISLPASADNNPNVKIAFNWTNNDDGAGSDPSFAVDSIRLSAAVITSVPNLNANNIQLLNDGNEVLIKCPEPFKILAIHDILGRKAEYVQAGNRLTVASPKAVYFIELEINGQRVTKKLVTGK